MSEIVMTRSFAVVANEKWIVWINSLHPVDREDVLRNELFYFDEFVACRMTVNDILEDARL